MKWFKNAYDRAEAAEYVLDAGLKTGITEEYHPGFRRSTWAEPSLGALAIVHHYPRRMVFNRDEGYDDPVANPFFRVQLSYCSLQGEKVSTMIEFDNNYAYLKRSSEYTNPYDTKPDETMIWDEAMAVLDESLLMHAIRLGEAVLPVVLERAPQEQFKLLLAA